jgi:hypothetical protein
VFPGGTDFDQASEIASFGARVPAFAEAGVPSGVIIEAIGGGRSDPCDPDSSAVDLEDGPQSVIDYLKSVPGVAVSDERETVVSGLPAVQATVLGVAGKGECEDLYIWERGTTEPFSGIPLGVSRRLIAVDVDGDHVVISVYGESTNPAWKALADQLIGSIKFD